MKIVVVLGFLACTAGCATTASERSESARNALTGEKEAPPPSAPAEETVTPEPGPAKEGSNAAEVAAQNACLSALKASLGAADGSSAEFQRRALAECGVDDASAPSPSTEGPSPEYIACATA